MVLLQKMGAIGDGTRNGMLSTGFLIDTKKLVKYIKHRFTDEPARLVQKVNFAGRVSKKK
ncbi:hypothetical protein NME41_10480 [Streptococcus agalactiae]|uniref:hypothetical protein n=1 Tax=Streptococcus agalactiae TaxID=1311 RepID=UPI00214D26CF|nr:hypothetical protein [Streptococcus agalactiae]MCP9190924.1 hypothetical protein [Streptococcus agalactiae]